MQRLGRRPRRGLGNHEELASRFPGSSAAAFGGPVSSQRHVKGVPRLQRHKSQCRRRHLRTQLPECHRRIGANITRAGDFGALHSNRDCFHRFKSLTGVKKPVVG